MLSLIAKIGWDSLTIHQTELISNRHAQLLNRVDDHEDIQDVILKSSDLASCELSHD
ncbi:hypothetical protein [Bythopirellula polymerisocia]|uniref:Uncharacterized protein n=1 Tax=Bythopirellula polymerisocia TaxID=2528003 RepID=A0A5C6D004_9BACT|nr:hypothetical protein [Bythopirellula polymerisocia]TWU30028.1 hypothetical protein Pla144_08140 [Bythopirellula polymerisocia]